MTSKKYWILVVPKSQVQASVREGFAQAGQGRALPLKHMNKGDGLIYYSPKLRLETEIPCQEFTAIGVVSGDEVYPHITGNSFKPYRRCIKYIPSRSVPVKPLIGRLQFMTDKNKWGAPFRLGVCEIPEMDFKCIAEAMKAASIT